MSVTTSSAANENQSDGKPPGPVLIIKSLPAEKPIIAIDLDDVLSQTNRVVAEWHNDTYASKMTLDQFYYYYYWRNPYWGSPDETFRKVEEFYQTPRLYEAPPIEGAHEGLQALKDMGFNLVVVTARQVRELERTENWIATHYHGIFDTIICTGMSQETLKDQQAMMAKLSKADVCKKLGAKLMIDDSLENALKCIDHQPPVPTLLFGDYQWNKRQAQYVDIRFEVSFDERHRLEGGREWWKDDEVEIPESAPLKRVNHWKEVVSWVEQNLKSE
ncbi:uncharacterized protein LAESUDRAFT_726129 [Laetiporus sulphureus 93-53]|uniref:HAD-like protein n=1 Tax=Laetiporus sulphureus 93-53 TaxID=1314785 RepID=A0A165E5Y8_9APHY|nr:uncharacterized protein LAESUDRAFT_726129 [Laetiporus sulphureus 93-53]KZT06302.1 hypothetical protein LAESUDRAFT_726129 [Laetiporus sulphureus 93-53]